jgi:hypothetical protein
MSGFSSTAMTILRPRGQLFRRFIVRKRKDKTKIRKIIEKGIEKIDDMKL